jgi:hypothetical protein
MTIPTVWLKKARTMEELRLRIDEAIKMAGQEATWDGLEDMIVVHAKDKEILIPSE